VPATLAFLLLAMQASPLTVGKFQPIYDPALGEKEPWCLNDHCFIKGPDKQWHLFGITHVKPFNFAQDPGRNLAHATAKTLGQNPWKKERFAVTIDPEKYDEHLFWAPHIVKDKGLYHMFVCVGAKEGHTYAIHRLTSKDLWTWERAKGNPILKDGFDGRDPMVIRDGDQWVLYYTANSTSDGGNHIVAAVTSKDLVRWSNRKVVFTHPREGTFAGPTESPFVVRRGPRYYLFITDNDIVHVYASASAFHWKPEDHVYEFKGHACEVVRDESGKWFVSHVGWMNGGLELAPIDWSDGMDRLSSSLSVGNGE
jgi:arabinan endo-1,5-alpha-L-arabinosidase